MVVLLKLKRRTNDRWQFEKRLSGLSTPVLPNPSITSQSSISFKGSTRRRNPLYQRLIAIREKQRSQPEALSEAMERYACLLHKTKREDEAGQLERQGRAIAYPPAERFIEGGVINGKAL